MLVKATLVCSWIALSLSLEECWPPCGCFNDDPPYDDRPLPESPHGPGPNNGQDIKWELFTRTNRQDPVTFQIPDDGSDFPVPPEFDASKPTAFLIHGWLSDSRIFDNIKDVMLDDFDFNIISVDWSTGAWNTYEQSSSNVRLVGACSGAIADTFHNGDVTNIHCIGHSLGAQTCGQMGKFVQNDHGVTLGRISGLDQAIGYFDTDNLMVRLDKADADFVDVIRTSEVTASNMVDPYNVGHVNFVPNKAGRQPGCDSADDPDNCDHWACLPFYRDSIENRDTCTYPAFPCDNFQDADACNCETCEEGVDCQSMGYYANQYPGRGIFYLRTKPGEVGPIDPPFCEPESENPCTV